MNALESQCALVRGYLERYIRLIDQVSKGDGRAVRELNCLTSCQPYKGQVIEVSVEEVFRLLEEMQIGMSPEHELSAVPLAELTQESGS